MKVDLPQILLLLTGVVLVVYFFMNCNVVCGARGEEDYSMYSSHGDKRFLDNAYQTRQFPSYSTRSGVKETSDSSCWYIKAPFQGSPPVTDPIHRCFNGQYVDSKCCKNSSARSENATCDPSKSSAWGSGDAPGKNPGCPGDQFCLSSSKGGPAKCGLIGNDFINYQDYN